MSALLALTTAMAGTAFDCEIAAWRFAVFAPADEETFGYEGDIAELYKVTAPDPDSRFHDGWSVRLVFDGLPENLFLSLAHENVDFPVEVTIFDLDQQTRVARAELKEDFTPASAKSTMLSFPGTCSFMPLAGKDEA